MAKATQQDIHRFIGLAVREHPKSFMGFVPATFSHPRLNPVVRQLAGFGEFAGDQSTFSKIRKIVWLILLAVLLVVAKFYLKKIKIYTSTGRLTGLGEIADMDDALDSVDDNLLPVFGLYASGPALQLLIGKDFPILTWAGLASGVGYGAYRTGPSAIKAVKAGMAMQGKLKNVKALAGLAKKKKRKKKRK